ncbi:MAG: hypothetical protein E7161_02130 [Firmicutes bacterium]|nr:hypothetical protein [Bacillota bacterium]
MYREKIIWIKIETNNYYKVLIKLNNIGVTLYDNEKIKDCILIKTTYSDYKRIKRYLVSYKISIYSSSGLEKTLGILKKYEVFVVSIIIGIIILFLANNMIFKVEVKSSNKGIQELLVRELNQYGLGKMKLKKNHKKVELIVNKILDDNKDNLEWLEVKYEGLIMIVNVTEKTKTENSEEYPRCNIVASTDAKITSLNIYRGVPLKEINDYVLKGEVILSGDIIHNEEIKNTVCASGEIYGEVWYNVKVEIPFKESYVKYTGKNRYNLSIELDDNKYQIFRSRIMKMKEEKTNLYKLNDFEINLVKEKEYITETKILSEEEAYNKGINKALEKVNLTLEDNEEILLKKVLKKDVNDSKIYLEIFIVTKENIGVLQVVREEVENGVESNT